MKEINVRNAVLIFCLSNKLSKIIHAFIKLKFSSILLEINIKVKNHKRHLLKTSNSFSNMKEGHFCTLPSCLWGKGKIRNAIIFVSTQMEVHFWKSRMCWQFELLICFTYLNNMKSVSAVKDGRLIDSCALGKIPKSCKILQISLNRGFALWLGQLPYQGSKRVFSMKIYVSKWCKISDLSVFILLLIFISNFIFTLFLWDGGVTALIWNSCFSVYLC